MGRLRRLKECDAAAVAEMLAAADTVLLHCGTDWCAPCKRQERVLQELVEAVPDLAVVGKVNVEDHPELAASYGVSRNPTLFLFRKGRLMERREGFTDGEAVLALVRGYAD